MLSYYGDERESGPHGPHNGGAWTIREQPAQLSFGRTVRTTLKLAGTYSSVSDTSSPRWRSVPPQSGQASCFGAIVLVSRGRVAGNGRRAGLRGACCFSTMVAGTGGGGSAAAWLASRSSNRSSRCWMSWVYFSERG